MTVQERIETRLKDALEPTRLEVDNESDRHNVPRGAETHFRVTIVADAFADLPLIQRHRRVNRVLAEELAGPVHALALHTYTPQEWAGRDAAPTSPPCLGGDAR
jgi:BolA protein